MKTAQDRTVLNRTSTTCPICGNGLMVTVKGVFETTFKDGEENFTIKVPNIVWMECESCKEIILDDLAAKTIDAAKYERLGLLSPQSILALRQRFGKTQEQMADLLRVGRKTYCRWENGTYFQTRAYDTYLRLVSWLLDKHENPVPILEGLTRQTSEASRTDHREDRSHQKEIDENPSFEPNLLQHRSARCCRKVSVQCS